MDAPAVGELVVLLVCLGVATHLVFRMPSSSAPETVALHPMTFLAFPFLLWATLRFEARGSTLATTLLSAVALWHTAHGRGPFAQAAEHNISLVFLQSFLAAASVSGLLLASVLGERRRPGRGAPPQPGAARLPAGAGRHAGGAGAARAHGRAR